MRVTRAQAEENRRAVIDAASRLFRANGFDGIGLADLMRAAGLTHGGFYKQFTSKDDLVEQASARALASGTEKWKRVIDGEKDNALAALVRMYLSRSHRDRLDDGCALAALGCDVVRRDAALHRHFEHGIREHAALLGEALRNSPAHGGATDPLAALSTMVGALLLARLVDDDDLSGQILDAATHSLLGPGAAHEQHASNGERA